MTGETSKMVQYEYRVVVWAHEDAWPEEVRYRVEEVLKSFSSAPVERVLVVERVRDLG